MLLINMSSSSVVVSPNPIASSSITYVFSNVRVRPSYDKGFKRKRNKIFGVVSYVSKCSANVTNLFISFIVCVPSAGFQGVFGIVSRQFVMLTSKGFRAVSSLESKAAL